MDEDPREREMRDFSLRGHQLPLELTCLQGSTEQVGGPPAPDLGSTVPSSFPENHIEAAAANPYLDL